MALISTLLLPRRTAACAIVAFASIAFTSAPVHAHEGEMHIGRTSAGALVIHDFDFHDFFTLTPASLPLTGWTGDAPSFAAIVGDDPAADVYALGADAKIAVEVILFSPALKLWNHHLDHAIFAPADRLSLGAPPFGDHTTWNVDAADPAFDPLATEWTATFRLVDTGTTAYTPTEAHTLHFTTVPAPLTLAPLAFLAIRRRR